LKILYVVAAGNGPPPVSPPRKDNNDYIRLYKERGSNKEDLKV